MATPAASLSAITVIVAGPNTVRNPYSNPAQLVEQSNFSGTSVDRLIASFYGEIKPLKGLTIKTQYGIDNARVEDQLFW